MFHGSLLSVYCRYTFLQLCLIVHIFQKELRTQIAWQICLAAPIAVNPETLEAYKKLVQMNRGYNHIPLMYFIVEPFSLSMLCMARNVPISLLGLVLARNESECFRAVNPDEPLTLRWVTILGCFTLAWATLDLGFLLLLPISISLLPSLSLGAVRTAYQMQA